MRSIDDIAAEIRRLMDRIDGLINMDERLEQQSTKPKVKKHLSFMAEISNLQDRIGALVREYLDRVMGRA